jgi:hypothetical protein
MLAPFVRQQDTAHGVLAAQLLCVQRILQWPVALGDLVLPHFYSAPAAAPMPHPQLHVKQNGLLWLAIVGVTEQYLLGHIELAVYNMCADELTRYVASINGDGLAQNEEYTVDSAGEAASKVP